jgi:hypothetical protein
LNTKNTEAFDADTTRLSESSHQNAETGLIDVHVIRPRKRQDVENFRLTVVERDVPSITEIRLGETWLSSG